MICNLSSITIYRSNCTGLDASAEPSNISLGNNRVSVCVCVCVRCGCWHVTYKERAVDCHGLVEHHQCLIENHQLTSVNFFLGFLFLSKNIVYHHFSFYPLSIFGRLLLLLLMFFLLFHLGRRASHISSDGRLDCLILAFSVINLIIGTWWEGLIWE